MRGPLQSHPGSMPAKHGRVTKSMLKAEKQYQLGLAASQRNEWHDAAAAFERACRLYGADAVFWANLAQARRKLGEHDRCVDAARRALRIAPDLAVANQLLADGLLAQHQYEEAATALHEIAAANDTYQAQNELANALFQAGQVKEAINHCMKALVHRPQHVPSHVLLGNLFRNMKLHREAMECFLTASVLEPAQASLLAATLYEALAICDWDRYNEHIDRLAQLVQESSGAAPVPFMFLSMSDTRSAQLRVAQAFIRGLSKMQALPPCPPYAPQADRRPRVGYLSYDLRNHPVAVNIVEVLELHDPAAVDLHVYSYGPDDGSSLRKRVEAATGAGFVDAQQMSNRALAQRIRDDGIELLIDLTGFMKDSRSGLLALRPAPIQASYLGFPGTSGADFIDYLICDAEIAPLAHAADYSEKLAHLPVTYQPNDRKRGLLPAPPRQDCGLPENAFVFCCMNNNYKITPDVFDRWCRLLAQVDGSVLWLLDANAQAKENLRKHAAARSIDPARIVFAPFTTGENHLARIRNADLFLDTRPYNAHTTGGDTLWAGVPVLTCPGQGFAARVAGSLLKAVGLPELVASSMDEYEAIALRLATHRDELQALRDRLWANRETCALFDSARSTRELEALYARMVQRWRDGLEADHLPADHLPAH